MSSTTSISKIASNGSTGYDAPVVSRADDHLSRWPFARQLFNIATAGPKDWSVRIGMYGEWGSGKSSVLKLIATMGEDEGHVVVWFDPWEYRNKSELWSAFVLTVFNQLENKLGEIPGADRAKRKAWLSKAKAIIGSVTSIISSAAGKAVEVGLDLVKKHFSFSQEDLKSLDSLLGGKRIIVLIDDLDRTAPELVPEILFALKELMNLPSFSFICAFDPIVVGEVLGSYHPGFRDGVKFLDKILDYPRWLSPPSIDGLTRLALSEAKKYCEFVPEDTIRDAILLLPQNPRTIRQFIRLLALVRPQIGRHYSEELCWPAIVSAHIIKILYPRIAPSLLSDNAFWDTIGLRERGIVVEPQETVDPVAQHVDKVLKEAELTFDQSQMHLIRAAMTIIYSQTEIVDNEKSLGRGLAYQVNLTEAPAAVTSKEFDQFLTEWEPAHPCTIVKGWIGDHAQLVACDSKTVFRDLLFATVRRYVHALARSDDICTEEEKLVHVQTVTSLFALANCLIFEVGSLSEMPSLVGHGDIEFLLRNFEKLIENELPAHSEFASQNEAFIVRLFKEWRQNGATSLVRILGLRTALARQAARHQSGVGKKKWDFYEKLFAIARLRLARTIVINFHEPRFVSRILSQEKAFHDIRYEVLSANGPLWSDLQSETFQVLQQANVNQAIQENAYQLLLFLVLEFNVKKALESRANQTLLSVQVVFDQLWHAATATRLTPRAVLQIKALPEILHSIGIKFKLPAWWQETTDFSSVPASLGGP